MELARPEDLGFSPARLARIGAVMRQYIDRKQFAGTVTMVARHGRLVHFDTAGFLDLESNKPMRRNAIFRIYSMTKPVTSTAVMMLVEEARLRLSDPVSLYLPGFKKPRVLQNRPGGDFDLVPANREITVRDLLTHTAGLSYGFEQKSYLDDLYRQRVWTAIDGGNRITLDEAVNEVARLPLAYQPGTAYRYSFATDVLGYLVQVISGKPFEIFLRERIFEPLGMLDTAFWISPDKISRLASCYTPDETGKLKIAETPLNSDYTRPTRYISGGGGLVSTADDYMRFCQMLLNKGRMGSARILGRKTVDLMFLNHLPAGVTHSDPGLGFGLGGSVLLDPAQAQSMASVGTWSWGGAANTKFWIDPQEDLVGILMTQFLPGDMYPISQDFTNLVYQALVD